MESSDAELLLCQTIKFSTAVPCSSPGGLIAYEFRSVHEHVVWSVRQPSCFHS